MLVTCLLVTVMTLWRTMFWRLSKMVPCAGALCFRLGGLLNPFEIG